MQILLRDTVELISGSTEGVGVERLEGVSKFAGVGANETKGDGDIIRDDGNRNGEGTSHGDGAKTMKIEKFEISALQ